MNHDLLWLFFYPMVYYELNSTRSISNHMPLWNWVGSTYKSNRRRREEGREEKNPTENNESDGCNSWEEEHVDGIQSRRWNCRCRQNQAPKSYQWTLLLHGHPSSLSFRNRLRYFKVHQTLQFQGSNSTLSFPFISSMHTNCLINVLTYKTCHSFKFFV